MCTGQPGRQERPVIVARSGVGNDVTAPRNEGDTAGCDAVEPASNNVPRAATLTSASLTSRGGRIRTDETSRPQTGRSTRLSYTP